MNCDRIASISRMSRSIPARRPGSVSGSISSANCTRVNGVRRSCEIPASIRLRSAAASRTSPLARSSTDCSSRTSRGAPDAARPTSSPRTSAGAAAASAFSGCARRRAKYAAASNTSSAQPASSSTENCRAPTRAPWAKATHNGCVVSSFSHSASPCEPRPAITSRSSSTRRARFSISENHGENPSGSATGGSVRTSRPLLRNSSSVRARGCARSSASTDSAKASRLCSNCTVGGRVVSSRPSSTARAAVPASTSTITSASCANTPRDARFTSLPRAGRRRSPRPTPSAACAAAWDPPRAACAGARW